MEFSDIAGQYFLQFLSVGAEIWYKEFNKFYDNTLIGNGMGSQFSLTLRSLQSYMYFDTANLYRLIQLM